MDRVQLHRFYREHEIRSEEDRPVPIFSASKILLLAQLAAGIVQGEEYSAQNFPQYLKYV